MVLGRLVEVLYQYYSLAFEGEGHGCVCGVGGVDVCCGSDGSERMISVWIREKRELWTG